MRAGVGVPVKERAQEWVRGLVEKVGRGRLWPEGLPLMRCGG